MAGNSSSGWDTGAEGEIRGSRMLLLAKGGEYLNCMSIVQKGEKYWQPALARQTALWSSSMQQLDGARKRHRGSGAVNQVIQ